MNNTCQLSLLQLPEHLLHLIASHLDAHYQRYFYFSSSYLRSKWQLRMLAKDTHWHLLSSSLDLLLQNCAIDAYDLSRSWAEAHCCYEGHRTYLYYNTGKAAFTARFIEVYETSRHESILDKQDIVRKLSSGIGVISTRTHIETKTDVKWHALKAVAEQLFLQLKQCEGYLLLCAHQDEEKSKALNVALARYDGIWEVDGITCVTAPPELCFDLFPQSIVSLRARFYSDGYGTHDSMWIDDMLYGRVSSLAAFDPGSQAKTAFAYKGNIDAENLQCII